MFFVVEGVDRCLFACISFVK